MARVWRDGQKNIVYIYRFITTGTIEEKIFQRQVSKQGLSSVVQQDKSTRGGRIEFSLQDLKDLFTLRNGTRCETHDLLRCKKTCSATVSSQLV